MMVLLKSSIIQLFGIWVAVSCVSGLLIFLIVKFFNAIFPNQSSTDRYLKNILAVWFFFLLNMSGTYYIYGSLLQEKQKMQLTKSGISSQNSSTETLVVENINGQSPVDVKEIEHFNVTVLLKYLGVFWIVGVLIFTIKMIGGYFHTRSLILSSQQSIPEKWSQFIIDKLEKLNIKKDVKVFESSSINSVFTVGFFKPMIVMPIGFFTSIPPEQIEAVLWHELYHIKYKDYLVNLMTMTFEIIFFYHPVMWWLSKNIRIERENRCDDQVTKLTDKKVYAHALLNMESYRQSLSYTIPFSNKPSNLKMRIMRIFEQKPEKNMGLKPFLSILVLIVFLMSFTFYKLDQSKPRLESSVKELLKETKVGAGDLRKSSEDVLFKSENSHLGVVLEMTQNTLIAKSFNKNVKLFLDGKSKALNKLHPFGENQIATMFTVEKEASYYFFTRQYFENHDREKWEKDNENRNTYVFDRSTEFFTFQPAKKFDSTSDKKDEAIIDALTQNPAISLDVFEKAQRKTADLSEIKIPGPVIFNFQNQNEVVQDTSSLELLKRLMQKFDANEQSGVRVKINGKLLDKDISIETALGVREIKNIKIVMPSKDAKDAEIDIITNEIVGEQLGDVMKESDTIVIDIRYKTNEGDFAGEMRMNFEKDEVLDVLNFKNESILFVIEGEVKELGYKPNDIDPNGIDHIVVLKDKKAIDKYGEIAKNGVVEIYLKKE